MEEAEIIKYWVELVVFVNHDTIFLQMDKQNDKSPSPFKFNALWLYKQYNNLI